MRDTASRTPRRTGPEGVRLGERLRQLRVAAGLTQSELAGDRFSKEYVSQIERGKTRPTEGTIAWLADRLGVDAGFLSSGVAADERGRIEGALARAEALYDSGDVEAALDRFEQLFRSVRSIGLPELEVRTLLGLGRTKMRHGAHREALELLNQARAISESSSFSDVERAEVLFRLGTCRYQLSSIQTAVALFNEALGLAERSGMPSDNLRSNILSWRARCWRRQRDYEAAREDVELALELAQGVDDPRTIGAAFFQASLVAEREGRWALARTYADQAREAYAQLADREHVAQLTNNLGGINFLLGRTDEAVELLKESFRVALDSGYEADAGRAVSSLAHVHLQTGGVEQAEEHARHALQLLEGRVDYLEEVGTAHLVLGRALLEQERLDEAEESFRSAESCFEQLGSAGHRAAAWVARGDLAARRGDDKLAAHLYRTAAEALQDVRF